MLRGKLWKDQPRLDRLPGCQKCINLTIRNAAGLKRSHNMDVGPDGEIGRRSGLKIRRP